MPFQHTYVQVRLQQRPELMFVIRRIIEHPFKSQINVFAVMVDTYCRDWWVRNGNDVGLYGLLVEMDHECSGVQKIMLFLAWT